MAQKEQIVETKFTHRIRAMFDSIAPTYDILNRLNTGGLDVIWRKDLTRKVAQEKPKRVLDLAAGTCDLSIMLAKSCKGARIVATDLSHNMLRIGAEKASGQGVHSIEIEIEDAMQLTYENNTFDAVTCAFGVRNFESIAHGYEEMFRVLKPGGMVAILELCIPQNALLRLGYDVHMNINVPLVSQLFGRREGAYDYLRESVKSVPQREKMSGLMSMAGFTRTYYDVYPPGVCAIYVGYKPENDKYQYLESIIRKIDNR